MRRFLGVLIVSLSLSVSIAWAEALPSARPEEVGLSAERLARIGKVLQGEIQAKKIPGAVAVVARKGRIAYFESLGTRDPAGGAPMTKPLASVAAMILAEEGRIVLTDPVSKYLPAFAKMQVSVPKVDATGRLTYETVPAAREMTVYDLLRHTSGLAYGEITANAPVKEAYAKAGVFQADFPYEARGIAPAEEVDRLAKAPLAHHPGEIWEYSLSVDLLGRVVEAAAGTRLSEFLDARLFKPLKMTDSAFSVPKEKMGRLAQPFPIDPATGGPNRVFDVSAPPKNDSGGVGAVATAADYLRFAQMLLNGGQLDRVRILGRATVAQMSSDHLGDIRVASPILPRGYGFGLGFAVRKETGVNWVTGSAGEYRWGGAAGTAFWVDPKEQMIVVWMTQAQPGPRRGEDRDLFRQLVQAALVD